MHSLIAGFLLAAAVAKPPLSLPATGTGKLEVIFAEMAGSTWSLGGLVGSEIRTVAVAPRMCVSTCPAQFGQTVTGLNLWAPGGSSYFANLEFSGPVVLATATQICVGCEPRGFTWEALWNPTPITMRGWLYYIGEFGPVRALEIAGRGTGTAFSHFEEDVNPSNYSMIRWDFRYSVVPEPSAPALSAAGSLALLLLLARRRQRSVRSGARGEPQQD